MRIELDGCAIRSWRPDDAPSIARHANSRDVWINLRDRFPHPYTEDDARRFIRSCLEQEPATDFAIEVDGEAAGSIGFLLGSDVERQSAEVGYWLGQRFWGRGLMARVLCAARDFALETYGLNRLFAVPFAWNAASLRVLEKAGFLLEGRLRRSAVKDGHVVDQLLYAYVVPADGETPPSRG